MEVRLIIGGVARKFWYRDGIADVHLVEFASGSSSSSSSVTTVSWQFMEIPSGNIDGTNTVFNLANSPSPTNSLMFFVNGVLQMQGEEYDYSLSSNTVSLNIPPQTDSKVVATYSYTQLGTSISWMEVVQGTKDGVNLSFTIDNSPSPSSSLMLFVNGVLQLQNADYTLSGNTITMVYAPLETFNLTATYSY